MRSLNLFRWAGALMLAMSLSPERVVAQDTLVLTGTFTMDQLVPTVGADLAGIQPNASDRWWKLTLNGVTYSYDWYGVLDEYGVFYVEWGDITYVHATSFTMEFIGPDAATLNQVVSGQLGGGGYGDAFLFLVNATYYNPYFSPPLSSTWSQWSLSLAPVDPATGVSFDSWNYSHDIGWFPTANGSPVPPAQLFPESTTISDRRNGATGSLVSYVGVVNVGSNQPPPPPPPAPTIAIADASVLEGDRGAKTLRMTVTLSHGASTKAVTVNFNTLDGTATVAGKDYASASGTLIFKPGETTKSIFVSIKGDRQREPNETFSVQLGNVVGATIADGVGVATILNDD